MSALPLLLFFDGVFVGATVRQIDLAKADQIPRRLEVNSPSRPG